MKKEILITKWIDDMVKNGFMSGFGGDKSDEFKKEQYDTMMKVLDGNSEIIGGNYRLLATIHSDYSNLKHYCRWTEIQLKSLLKLFNFEKIEEVVSLMNCNSKERDSFMEKCKLKDGVTFYLTPRLT